MSNSWQQRSDIAVHCLSVNVKINTICFFWIEVTEDEISGSQYSPMRCIPISEWSSYNWVADGLLAQPIDDMLNFLHWKWPAQLWSSIATHPMQLLSAFSNSVLTGGKSENQNIHAIDYTFTTFTFTTRNMKLFRLFLEKKHISFQCSLCFPSNGVSSKCQTRWYTMQYRIARKLCWQ